MLEKEMFLSLYIAYHLAGKGKLTYIPIMAALTTLMSLLSSGLIVLYDGLTFLVTAPFLILSFPFFILPCSSSSFFILSPLKVTFFQMEIFPISYPETLSLVFPFFLLINFSGAILGYSIHKAIPEGFLEGDVLHYFSKYLFLTLLFICIFGFILIPFFYLSHSFSFGTLLTLNLS